MTEEQQQLIEQVTQGFAKELKEIEAVPPGSFVIFWGSQLLYTDDKGTIGSVIAQGLDRSTARVWHGAERWIAESRVKQWRKKVATLPRQSVEAVTREVALERIRAQQESALAMLNRKAG